MLALGEDRHRVLNPDRGLNLPDAPAQEVVRQAEDQIWELGSIVPRHSEGRQIFDVVVYDLDASPMVEPAVLERGLCSLVEVLVESEVFAVAMEPIGMMHAGIGAEAFAHALRAACAKAERSLEILLCHPDRDLLDALDRFLHTLH